MTAAADKTGKLRQAFEQHILHGLSCEWEVAFSGLPYDCRYHSSERLITKKAWIDYKILRISCFLIIQYIRVIVFNAKFWISPNSNV